MKFEGTERYVATDDLRMAVNAAVTTSTAVSAAVMTSTAVSAGVTTSNASVDTSTDMFTVAIHCVCSIATNTDCAVMLQQLRHQWLHQIPQAPHSEPGAQ